LFDTDRSGSISLHEFAALFNYINDWKRLFESIDRDRSGFIEEGELSQGRLRCPYFYFILSTSF
jgi:Ca2+-binding EF-hand superfamily protein